MEQAHRWISRDLSRLELVVALLIMALLIGVFVHHALRVFAHAERSAVMVTVTNINNALLYRSLMLAGNNNWEGLAGLAKVNPMALMRGRSGEPLRKEGAELRITDPDVAVGNYLGEYYDPDPSTMKGGSWYFDRNGRLLVYLVNNDEFFISDLEGPARIVYQIRLEYEDVNGNGVFDPPPDEFGSVRLVERSNTLWDI